MGKLDCNPLVGPTILQFLETKSTFNKSPTLFPVNPAAGSVSSGSSQPPGSLLGTNRFQPFPREAQQPTTTHRTDLGEQNGLTTVVPQRSFREVCRPVSSTASPAVQRTAGHRSPRMAHWCAAVCVKPHSYLGPLCMCYTLVHYNFLVFIPSFTLLLFPQQIWAKLAVHAF